MRFSLQFFALFLGMLLLLAAPLTRSSDKATFLAYLQTNLIAKIDDSVDGIIDPALNAFAHQVWQEVVLQGSSVQSSQSDKVLRTVFGQIQAHAEALFLAKVSNIAYGQAVWIIHTPLIATPLVSEGKVSPGLISPDILSDSAPTRKNTALLRAKSMRDFLAKGGVIIAVYQGNLPNGQSGRTPQQMQIFAALKKQYPKQLIEFAISPEKLENGTFPADKIGATYLMQMANDEVIEMSIQGQQINQSKDNATWGVWLQESGKPNHITTDRITAIFQFLQENGLQEVLMAHAKTHGIARQEMLTLMTRYIVK